MGNTNASDTKPSGPQSASGNLFVRAFQTFEHRTGTRLVAAIKADSREDVDAAVEFARREFVTPRTGGVPNPAAFSDSVDGLIRYLTSPKDVGDGPLFTQAPVEFCRACRPPSLAALRAVEGHLHRLYALRAAGGEAGIGAMTTESIGVAAVGEPPGARAALARERLAAFQATRPQPKPQP